MLLQIYGWAAAGPIQLWIYGYLGAPWDSRFCFRFMVGSEVRR